MTKNHQRGFLTWEPPGKVIQVRLDHDVIERMLVDVMRGFGVTRRRGTEVGGVLLGKIAAADTPAVLIYDYEIVPCEYAQGPSYVLSERDLQAFRETVARWRNDISPDQHVVGYFRSHTRDDLFLDDSDVRQFHQHMKDPLALALVVKPFATRASEAGFFLQSGGRIETKPHPPEFQFIASETAVPKEARPPARAVPAPVPAIEDDDEDYDADPVPAVPSVPPPAPAPVPRLERPQPEHAGQPPLPTFGDYYPKPEPSWRTRLLWAAFTAAVFGFGSVVGYEYAALHALGSNGPARAPATAGSARAASDPYSVSLSAVEQDQSVLVRWDRESEAVKTALHGVLTITEGAASKEVKLEFPELRNGTVLYHKVGSQVSFRLDLYFKENRVLTESITLRFPVR